MKILLTGAAGFIGSHVTSALLAQGHKVIGVDNENDYYNPAIKSHRIEDIRRKNREHFQYVLGDIMDPAVLAVISDSRPDAICHLAAQAGVPYSYEKPMRTFAANVAATANLLETARKTGVKRFVYASSSSVYGGSQGHMSWETDVLYPQSIYAASKVCMETMARAYATNYGLETIGLRYFSVYGPDGRPDGVAIKFLEQLKAGETIKVYSHGNIWRDWTYIDDVVQVTIGALTAETVQCDIYNVGSGHARKLTAMISLLAALAQRPANTEMAGDQPGDVARTHSDNTRATEEFHKNEWTQLEDGLAEVVKWHDRKLRIITGGN